MSAVTDESLLTGISGAQVARILVNTPWNACCTESKSASGNWTRVLDCLSPLVLPLSCNFRLEFHSGIFPDGCATWHMLGGLLTMIPTTCYV